MILLMNNLVYYLGIGIAFNKGKAFEENMKLCHKMKVYKRGNNGDSRPEIRLLGSWLDKIGFSVGQEICVTILENDRILIEKNGSNDAEHFNELEKFFNVKSELRNQPALLNWIRKHGGIKRDSVAADLRGLSEKECGKSHILKNDGVGLDVLRDEAEGDGLISFGTSTEEFAEIIKDRVREKGEDYGDPIIRDRQYCKAL